MWDIAFVFVLLESAEIFLALRRSECKGFSTEADACYDVLGAGSTLALVRGP